MRSLRVFSLFVFLLPTMLAGAQQPSSPTTAASAQAAAPAYDTAVLPKNKKDAWAMLRAANGLHGKDIKPWIAAAHYKLFGPDGKVSVTGDLEIVWAAPDRWRNTLTEGGVSSTEWRTPDGTYIELGKPDGLDYPRDMFQDVLLDPIESSGQHDAIPVSLAKQKVFSVELSCLKNSDTGMGIPGTGGLMDNGLFCADPDRPILRIAEQEYAILLDQVGLFQGQFLGRQTIVRGEGGPLFELDLSGLAVASTQQQQTLDPPQGLKPTGWITVPPDNHEYNPAAERIHRLKMPEPYYPQSMKTQHIQGNVRFAAVIGVDGSLTVDKVLYSTSPAFTQSAEDAVLRWKYQPYLLHGKPVAVHLQIAFQYRMSY